MVKTLHFFWFGGAEKPRLVQKCIESWYKYLPDFEIKQWDESNFDVAQTAFTQGAWEAKKYAFVSDAARFIVLYRYGGLYFDTDVELIKPLGEILENDAFAAMENSEYASPGLVLWSKEKENPVIGEVMELYQSSSFVLPDGTFNMLTVSKYFTGVLEKYGFVKEDKLQHCGSFTIYPKECFCPYDDLTGTLHVTENTYAIHWFAKSWMKKSQIARNRVTRILHRLFGIERFSGRRRH